MNDAIEKAIVETLYEAWHYGRDQETELGALRERGGWDHPNFTSACDSLGRRGILRELGMSYQLTANGVLEAENSGVVRAELCEQNKNARSVLCCTLAEYARRGMTPVGLPYQVLADTCQIDEAVTLNNLELLEELDYVCWLEVGCVSLTERGYGALEEGRRLVALADEFQRVSEMEPHERGRAFQTLFAKLLEHSGWNQLEGVRTSNEELDVVVYRGREYYLIECKWERQPIETKAVQQLFVKLTNRADVRGVLTSMSGFTNGAVEQAEGRANERVILFFGREDVNALFSGKKRFDDLLDHKYRKMVVMRRIIFA